MADKFEELGMNRSIPRRDFLNGAALGIAASSLALGAEIASTPQNESTDEAAAYPPLRSELRGNIPSAIAEFGRIRAGEYREFPVADVEIVEEYDLVIVGGGISGLAAAHFYRTALGPEQRILILDNHDDFGGHAKRNEFHHAGRMYIGYGGTMAIATPYPYSYAAKSLVSELGIDVTRSSSIANRVLDKYDLHHATFFDKEHFGEDQVVTGNPHQNSFFARAPLSEAARRDLIRVHGKNPDYLAGLTLAEKIAKLQRISHLEFLRDCAKVSPDALPFFYGEGARNNKRVDTIPALEAARNGAPGFNGLGLHLPQEFNEGSYFLHFPDGNASIARLLVSKLIPSAIPGNPNMDSIVQTRADYKSLDVPGASVRIRLGSSVVRVQHAAEPVDASSVKIAYRREGKTCAVRGTYCILACYNALIPALLPEIPSKQKEALAYPVKVPMMYTNVLLRNWTAWQRLGISSVSGPCMYYQHTELDPGTTVGGYQGATTPNEPILVHMMRNANKPGLPRKEQNRAGQEELLSMTFEQHEFQIRDQLSRILKAGGFDPAEDILAITVNRWPYGYAYTYDTLADPDVPPEERPHVIGRKRFGRVTIANSDAGAAAFTNQAIDEANRAVQEILVHQGLT
jgi:spermidine dehydrogenase